MNLSNNSVDFDDVVVPSQVVAGNQDVAGDQNVAQVSNPSMNLSSPRNNQVVDEDEFDDDDLDE